MKLTVNYKDRKIEVLIDDNDTLNMLKKHLEKESKHLYLN